MNDMLERLAEHTAELIRNGILDRIRERKEKEMEELNNEAV